MDRIKKGLSIFAFFFKIGCFTFGGGWAILAQMEQEFVDKRQIITDGAGICRQAADHNQERAA